MYQSDFSIMLKDIEPRDPDGWQSRKPTEVDRADFKNYVIVRYGRAMWDRYIRAGRR